MPGSASTRKGTSGRTHKRPQRPEIPSEIARTPVLFRLPEIDQFTEADLSELEGGQAVTTRATQFESAASDESFDLDASLEALELPPVPEAAPAQTESATPPVVKETPQSERIAQLASETEEQSWWEHWSSGVVLILLIIALITASIIAFSDGPGADPAQLADQGLAADIVDLPIDLDDIVIPGETVSAEAATNHMEENLARIELPQDADVPVGTPVATGPASETGDRAAESLIPDFQAGDGLLGGLSLANESPAQPGSTPDASLDELKLDNSVTATEGSVQSQLAPPIQGTPANLFPELPASVTGNTEPNQMANSVNTTSPEGMPTMPSLPAGEGTAASASAGTNENLLEQPVKDSPYRTVAGANSVNATNDAESDSTGELDSTAGAEVDASEAPQTQLPQIRETSTPDGDPNAYIRAYLEYKRISQAGNRYQSGEAESSQQ